MPAVVRGAAAERPKPRTRKSANGSMSRQTSAGGSAGASKLRAAQGLGLPPAWAAIGVLMVVGVGVMAMLATGQRGERLGHATQNLVDSQFAAAGFSLRQVQLQGVSPQARADVLAAAQVHQGQSLLGLDLDQIRQGVERVGWVRQARVVRMLPDTLRIIVDERRLMAVWERGGRLVVVDQLGQPVPEADPRRFNTLPLIVGTGANEAAAALLPTIARHPRVVQRLEALVRVDSRRWDLRLRDGTIIQLPAEGEDGALIQLEQLDRRSRVLDLGLARIDLRDPEMVAVRPRTNPTPHQTTIADGAG